MVAKEVCKVHRCHTGPIYISEGDISSQSFKTILKYMVISFLKRFSLYNLFRGSETGLKKTHKPAPVAIV